MVSLLPPEVEPHVEMAALGADVDGAHHQARQIDGVEPLLVEAEHHLEERVLGGVARGPSLSTSI